MALDNEHHELHRLFDERLAAAAANNKQTAATLEENARAMAFSLKIHADMIVSIDSNMEKNNADIAKLLSAQKNSDARIDRLTGVMEKLADFVHGHEDRIRKLEDGK